jgi:hypothetical protein
MTKPKRLTSVLRWIVWGMCLWTSSLDAASLKGSVYMMMPWGSQPGQAGRFIPPPKGDGYPAGPIVFTLDSSGNLYLADLFNQRVQRIDRNHQAHVLESFGKDATLSGIDVAEGKMFVIGDFGKSGSDRASKLIVGGVDSQATQEFDLNRLGIKSPQDIQTENSRSLFISDNQGLKTTRLEPSWKIVERVIDKKLFWLRSRGLYRFELKPNGTAVLSTDGKELTDYEGKVEVVGVNSKGVLYTLRDKAPGDQLPDIWLMGLSPSGQEKFQIHITEKIDAQLLDPRRFWEVRVARVGPDDAIYVMGDPEDDQFRIYRYEVKE